MNTWNRKFAFSVAVHVLFVVTVGSVVAVVGLFRPAYETMDVLVIVAVGMVAGILYVSSMDRLAKALRSR